MRKKLCMEGASADGSVIELVADMDGKSVFCHRSVLAKKSEYFSAMFSSGMLESTQRTITLGQIYGDDLMTIVKYCYKGVLDLEEDMVHRVMITANMLQLEAVEATCVDYLERHITATNCLEVASFAELLGCQALKLKAEHFAKTNFMQVTRTLQFFNLTLKEVVKLLSNDDLFVETEADIFASVCMWVNFNPIHRFPVFSQLLGVVRERNLPPFFYKELVHILGMSYSCQQPLIKEAFKVFCLDDKPSLPAKDRKWINSNILAISTSYLSNDLLVDYFCGRTKTWSPFGKIPVMRDNFGTAVLGGKLIIVGGFNDELERNWELKNVESFDLNTKQTTQLSPLLSPRSNLGVVVLDGYVYAIGGSRGASILSSAERYDPSTESWSAISPMSHARYAGSYAVLGGVIYALGGTNDAGELINAVECYDPSADEWTPRANMIIARTHAKVVADHDFLYVIGGHSWDSVVRDLIDRYDPSTDTWTQITPLLDAASFNCAFVGQELVAFKNKQTGANKWEMVIETYCRESNTWRQNIVSSLLCGNMVRAMVPIPTIF